MELFITFIGIIIVLWIIWRKKHLSTFKKYGIPGPEPNLLFGNLIELYRKGPIRCHEEWVKKYGRIVGYFYGMRPILLIMDPEILKNVFIKDFQNFMNREPFSPIFKYDLNDEATHSVSILRGRMWKNVRSILTPTFTAAKMKKMAGSMNSSIETMINILKENAESGKIFDVMDKYQRVTMDVITRTAFGVRTDVQTNFNSSLLRTTQVFFSQSYRDPFFFVGLSFPCLEWICRQAQGIFLGMFNRGRTPTSELRENLASVLDHRRKNDQGRRIDLLQLMVDSKIYTDVKEVDLKYLEIGVAEYEAKFSKEEDANKPYRRMANHEIISSAFAVLLAGYESTSTALTFTTYLIAKHQDIQQKLYEEIFELIQNGQKLEYGTISKLQYMDKVFNESLRFYPPVTLFNNRYALEYVEYGNLKIPKGMLIQAPVYLLHHDPEFWENPETFDPERFEDKTIRKGAFFMPFGVGPRNCLGMRLAEYEAKLVLAHILYNFKITLPEGSKENVEFYYKIRTITPKNGIPVKMELRNQVHKCTDI